MAEEKRDDEIPDETIPMYSTFIDITEDFNAGNLDNQIFEKVLQKCLDNKLGKKDTLLIFATTANTAFPFIKESKLVRPQADIENIGKIIIKTDHPVHSYVQQSIKIWLTAHKITKGSKVEFRINNNPKDES